MTLCISAVTTRPNALAIVSACDFRVSFGGGASSHEGRTGKIAAATGKYPERWQCLYAGDTSLARIIRSEAIHHLESMTAIDTHQVLVAYQTAFENARVRKIEDEILSRYRLTMEDFKATGLKIFGRSEFASLNRAIRKIKLKIDFLLAGFDATNSPVLFSISDPDGLLFHTDTYFHAIGIGAYLAEDSLSESFDHLASLMDVVYRVCEAKFRGEAADSVGRKTIVTIQQIKNGHIEWIGIKPDGVNRIRHVYETRGKPVPRESAQTVGPLLKYVFRREPL